jgi:hypothetical protein
LIQGISTVNTSACHSAQVTLSSRLADCSANINCAVLDQISGSVPNTKLDTSDWNLSTDITFADESFKVPGTIDLLFGANIFFYILRTDRLTRKGNHPVLQETGLGWIISGRTPAAKQNASQHALFSQPSNNFKSKHFKPSHMKQSFIPVRKQPSATQQQVIQRDNKKSVNPREGRETNNWSSNHSSRKSNLPIKKKVTTEKKTIECQTEPASTTSQLVQSKLSDVTPRETNP